MSRTFPVPGKIYFTPWAWLCLLASLLCGIAVVTADDTRSSALTVSVNSSVTGSISEPGDVDYWRINVPSAGQLVVETTGATDTLGVLEDSAGNQLDEHDDLDYPSDRNFRIEWAVTAGTYYIRVRAYMRNTGDYTLHVRHTPAAGGDTGGGSTGTGTGSSDARATFSPVLGDLNGDGHDDVLLRHTDGRWYYYPMNGRDYLSSGRGAAFLTSNLDWQFAGIGDLNGDGRDDVLVRRVTDGRWYYYPMDGRRHLVDQRGGTSIISDLAWQLAGIGDLNGDGKDDVLLRHRDDGRWLYYPMDGRTHITGGRGLANIPRDLSWQLAGIGDLNGDGRDDVLLRHTNGTWQYFPMNGRDYLRSERGAAFLTSNPDWQFAGLGDLNGDGRDDVLLRHAMTGRWYYYPMDGRRHITADDGGANIVSDLAWQLAGIGDLNGDGKDDVLLRHRDDGRWLYYPMDGREYLAGGRGTANITRDLAWTTAGSVASTPPEQPVVEDDTPDLVVVSPSVSDPNLSSGESFILRATVRNQGPGRAGSTTLRYYRSSDSTITLGDNEVGTSPVSALAASRTSAESINLSAPSTNGVYYYGACVDAVSAESNTGNNCSSGVRVTVASPDPNFTPTPLDDFEIEAGSLPTALEICVRDHQCEDGDEVRVSVNGVALFSRELFNAWYCETVTVNQRETMIELYAINGSGFKGSCDYSDINTGEIRVSGANSQTQSWAHNGGTGSRVNIIVTIGDGTGGGGSGDDHGDTRDGATSLAVGGSASGRIDPGNDVDYFIVQVNGSGTLTLYTTGNLDTQGELQNSSGARQDFDDDGGTGTNFRIEHSVSSGTYYIEVGSYRSNTGSYTLHAEFSGSGGTGGGNVPDLVVEEASVSDPTLSAGDTFILRATVRNVGTRHSSSTILRYYRSTDINISNTDTEVGTDNVGRLEPGESDPDSITLSAPSNNGTWYYGACVDDVSREENTRNNCSEGVRVRVTGGGNGGNGSTTQDCADCPEMISISGGTFQMGASSSQYDRERPVHSVTVPAFRMSKYEVTFAQWDACVADGGCDGYRPDDEGWGRRNRPVINVNWDRAQLYVDWLNSKTNGGYRLPSEAEWEYAARAGSTTEYSWGDDIGRNRANCRNVDCGDSYERTAPVGSFAANAWGLHDMHGNVTEWVQDCSNDSYRGAPNDGSAWTSSGNCDRRRARGGSWFTPAWGLRSAYRDGATRTGDFYDLGFRVTQSGTGGNSGSGSGPTTLILDWPCPFGDGGEISVPYTGSSVHDVYGVEDAIIRLSNNCGEHGTYWISATGGGSNNYVDDVGQVWFWNDQFYYKEGVPYISFSNYNSSYNSFYTGETITKQYTVLFCHKNDTSDSAFCYDGREVSRAVITVNWLPGPPR